jgi:hypothetical protein
MEGTTDSEQIFGIFLDHYRNKKKGDPMALVEATKETIMVIDELVRPYNEIEQTSLNLGTIYYFYSTNFHSDFRWRSGSLHSFLYWKPSYISVLSSSHNSPELF